MINFQKKIYFISVKKRVLIFYYFFYTFEQNCIENLNIVFLMSFNFDKKKWLK